MNREAMMQGVRRNRIALAVCFGAVLLALTAACDPDPTPAGRDIAIQETVASSDNHTVTYTIHVGGSDGDTPGPNGGPANPNFVTWLCPVTVTDILPPVSGFIFAGGSDWHRVGQSSVVLNACDTGQSVITTPSAGLSPITIVITAPPGQTVTNCVSVSNGSNTGAWAESNLANNTSCVTTTMPPTPANRDLAIQKLAVVSADGQTITYTIIVTGSNGSTTVGGDANLSVICPLIITDILPPGATFVSSGSGAGWGWNHTGSNYGVNVCAGPAYGVNSTLNVPSPYFGGFYFVASVPPGETVTNCASVSDNASVGGWIESNLANNTSCVTTTMPPAPAGGGMPDLAISKTAVVSGQTVTYTISIANVGTAPAAISFEVTDTLTPGTSGAFFSSANGSVWGCGGLPAGPVHCDLNSGTPALAPGDPPLTLTIGVTVPSEDYIQNCATVSQGTAVGSGATAEYNLTNNTACVEISTRPTEDPGNASGSGTGVTYVYSAKYVCGIVRPLGPELSQTPLPVASGVYRTAVNVHNFTKDAVTITKKAVIALPEDEPRGAISRRVQDRLRDDEALEVNCQDVVKLLENVDTRVDLQTGFVTGFIEIQSPVELEVTAVHTMGELANQDVKIDVEQVEPYVIKK
ncbi:MAG: hypothetical protein HW388_450 [Dehalococcoidia bacterium]|nr:hypothetical protein [Dehalococcoidia bacterium]